MQRPIALLVTVLAASQLAAGSAGAQWMWQYDGPAHSGAWMVVGAFWMLLFWTLAAISAVTVVRWIFGGQPRGPAAEPVGEPSLPDPAKPLA